MRRHSLRVLTGLSLALLVASGCSDDPAPVTTAGAGGSGNGGAGGAGAGGAGTGGSAGATAQATAVPLFELPGDLDTFGQGCSVDGLTDADGLCSISFFDHPMPSDFRRDAQGRVRWANFVRQDQSPPVTFYVSVLDRLLRGFSPEAAGFLRFKGTVDPSSLPTTVQASTEASSVVQLIDVDEASPERGKRHPISVYYREKPGAYWAPSTVAWVPAVGVPLRPSTRYAVVVTRALRASDGTEIGHAPELDGVLGLGTASAAASALATSWKGAIDAVETAGVARASIAHLSVFTTDDPAAELFAIRDEVHKSVAAPTAHDWAAKDTNATLDVYEGMYGPSPDFQQGTPPFAKPANGGAFAFDDTGKPVVQRTFELRFALATPKPSACPMPAAGYPVVLYAHGTGGNYRSFLGDGTAAALASRCVASMGIDQIFHGTRPGAPPDGPNFDNEVAFLFFNVDNPVAARTNGRQAAIDEVQRARLFTESHASVPPAVARDGQEIRIDPSKVLFFGHSQGGQNGPLYLAIDDSARGGVLSGSGGVFSVTLLEKTEPEPSIAQAVKGIFLALSPDQYEELNAWHPALALAQNLVDAADPIHYARYIISEPRAGFAPKSIYQTEGVRADGTGDSYTPPHSIEQMGVALGLPLQTPVIRPIASMDVLGRPAVTIPASGLSGNLASGKASGVLAQWVPPTTSDGHFVVFNVPAARAQAAQFCRNLADNPVGLVPAP